MMKNILLLHHGLGRGGAEMMKFVLLRNIDRTKYNVKVCCIGRKGVLGEEIERLGYKVDELRQNPNSLSIFITYKLIKYLRKEKPDILHTSLFNSNFHGRVAGLFSRTPHIITEEHGEHKQYNGIKFLPHILIDFFFSRLSDFIVCCSERLKEDIIKKEKLPRGKVMTIENCLDADMYTVNLQKEDIRKIHNIANETVFIMVASLKAGKGHRCLMDALRDVKSAGYRFKCFFAGEGPLEEDLRKRCRELDLSGEIIFLGTVDVIPDYLNASDVFILPSLSEGLSIALMEAMLLGLAPIVTDVGSNTDLIRAGFNGIVVMPRDKAGLKNAIIFYLQNKSTIKVFGERAREVIKTRYASADEYTRKYCALWDKCAG